ncbi:hypothetical protein [Sulfitobacter sp.]|uniref:hypothetical protein n=1 Tax=Sulfitobacter sp. TaxID=1903071 RepID=UPI003001A7ED
MSDPYVIWTMRRTGGTTLATLLNILSEHPSIQHEPFNVERKLRHIPKMLAEGGDVKQVRAELEDCLAHRPVIKHCYELMNPAFNKVLMKVTTKLGYRHIVLDRRSEAARVISLELAQLSGAWGAGSTEKIYPEIEAGERALEPINIERALSEMRQSHLRRQELVAMTKWSKPAPFMMYFEDVYTDHVAGRALIGRLLAYLGIRPEDHLDYDTLLEDALVQRGQNSVRIVQAVPDFDAAKAQLSALEAAQKKIFVAS